MAKSQGPGPDYDTLTRQVIQDLLAGNPPNGAQPTDFGPWANRVEILLKAYERGGQGAVYWEFNLMQDDLDLAAMMAGDDPQPAPNTQQATQQSPPPNPSGPTLTQPPVRLYIDQSPDDEGNAQCVNAVFGGQFVYCEAYGYLHWNGRFWSAGDAEAALERAIVFTLKQRRVYAVKANQEAIAKASQPSAKRVRDCKFLFRSLVTVDVTDFDKFPELLNCNNGVLDLRTGILTPHDPGQRFTYCVPVDYVANADQTLWRMFLQDVVGHGTPAIDYLQWAIGYSLTGYTREECLFYVFGPTRSGKGTFTETLLALLPKPIGVEVDFTTFTANRDQDSQNFDLAPLKPARLVFASESNKYQGLNTGKIKALTGGNEVRCAFKHRDHFSYQPQYKIWLVSNHPVNADVDDDAAWYRVKVIEFPNSMANKEDKSLKQKMREPVNLQGVLAWAVQGAMAWLNSPNGLITPASVQQATQKHRSDLDFVRTWLDECTVVDPAGWETSEDVYRSYSEWCKANGVKAKEQRGLSTSLKAKGFQVNVQRWTGTKNRKGILGLQIV